MSTSRVTVVGSGVIGSAIAWRLARTGQPVTWVTGDNHGSATLAAGAMLAIYSEVSSHQSDETVELEVTTRRQGRELWTTWLPELGVPAVSGLFVVGSSANDLAGLAAIRAAASDYGGSAETVEPTDVPGLHADAGHEPVDAVFLPDEATVDTMTLLDAFHDVLVRDPNVTVVTERAVEVRDGVVTTMSGQKVAADVVVLATGAETNSLLAASGLTELVPPVLGGRGVSMVVQATEPTEVCIRTPNRAFACGLHAVPRAGGLTYLGATNRLTTTPEPAVGPQLAEIDDLVGGCVRELDRRLRRAEVVSTAVGHRPVTPDRLPVAGRTSEPWLLVATATWRNGVVLAPVLADLVAEELGQPGSTAKHPFTPTRTWEPAPLDDAAIARAARGIVDTLTESALAPGRRTDLVAFLEAALTREVEEGNRLVTRLLQRAPMEEALPLVFDLIARQRR